MARWPCSIRIERPICAAGSDSTRFAFTTGFSPLAAGAGDDSIEHLHDEALLAVVRTSEINEARGKTRRGRDTPGIEHPIRAAVSFLPSRCAGFLLDTAASCFHGNGGSRNL